jgi:hypothetical protein
MHTQGRPEWNAPYPERRNNLATMAIWYGKIPRFRIIL